MPTNWPRSMCKRPPSLSPMIAHASRRIEATATASESLNSAQSRRRRGTSFNRKRCRRLVALRLSRRSARVRRLIFQSRPPMFLSVSPQILLPTSVVKLAKKPTMKVMTAWFCSVVTFPLKSCVIAVKHILVKDSIGVRSVVNS